MRVGRAREIKSLNCNENNKERKPDYDLTVSFKMVAILLVPYPEFEMHEQFSPRMKG